MLKLVNYAAMAPRKQISLQDKLAAIKDIDSGMKQIDVAKKHSLSQSTLATFLKKRKEIEDTITSNTVDPSRKRLKTATYSDVDAATLKWFQEQRALNIPINGPLLCQQAKKFACMLGVVDFKASHGWLARFRDRHGIVFKMIQGEEKCAPVNDANEWRENKMKEILGKYQPRDIYNADETGLYYQLLPERTLTFKGDNCKGGKRSKQRLTVLLCANMSGTHKLKPFVIGKSQNPRCFKGVKSLPGKTQFLSGFLRPLGLKRNYRFALYFFYHSSISFLLYFTNTVRICVRIMFY